MKSYGLDLQHSDVNSRASEILSGDTFPTDIRVGSVFYLTAPLQGFEIGEYYHNGTSWLPAGDITGVEAGYGLIGGGHIGEIALSLDAEVVKTIVQQVIAQDPIDPIAMSLIFGG